MLCSAEAVSAERVEKEAVQQSSLVKRDSSRQWSSEKTDGLVGSHRLKGRYTARSVISAEWYNCYKPKDKVAAE
jgi:hypothetical protein